MTTVQTRARQIAEVEGFDIVVTKDGSDVAVTDNGVLGAYPFTKALKNSKTVAEWRRGRFEATYPGFSCKVLMENGDTAAGQTSLVTVRESYEED